MPSKKSVAVAAQAAPYAGGALALALVGVGGYLLVTKGLPALAGGLGGLFGNIGDAFSDALRGAVSGAGDVLVDAGGAVVDAGGELVQGTGDFLTGVFTGADDRTVGQLVADEPEIFILTEPVVGGAQGIPVPISAITNRLDTTRNYGIDYLTREPVKFLTINTVIQEPSVAQRAGGYFYDRTTGIYTDPFFGSLGGPSIQEGVTGLYTDPFFGSLGGPSVQDAVGGIKSLFGKVF